MGFNMRWLKEGHVFICDFIEPVVNEEAPAFNDAIIEYFEASSRVLVHGIFDFTQSDSIFAIKTMSKFTFPKHPQMGWNIFVNLPNKQVRFFISIATQIFKVRVRIVDSMEEAVQFLEYVDQTITAD